MPNSELKMKSFDASVTLLKIVDRIINNDQLVESEISFNVSNDNENIDVYILTSTDSD